MILNKNRQRLERTAERHAEVEAIRAGKEAGGFLYAGERFQVDTKAVSNMLTVFAALLAGLPSPHGGVWRSMDNVNVPMDDLEVRDFILAAKGYVQGLLVTAWGHKDALTAMTTLAEVEAYDITTGWG